jgi:hypothetical protein
MYSYPDTHLRMLILEREIELRRAARERRFDAAFDEQRATVLSRRYLGVRSLADRVASGFRSLRRLRPLAST